MARLRLLLALFLVAVGTTFGALAISGYYEPHMRHGQSMMAVSSGTPQPAEKPQLALWLPKPGFVAGDERPAAKTPAKPKVVAKTVPTKPKPATRRCRWSGTSGLSLRPRSGPGTCSATETSRHAGAQQIVHVHDADGFAPSPPRTSACA